MITKELFIDSVEVLESMDKFTDSLCEIGIDIMDLDAYNDAVTTIIDLLKYCTEEDDNAIISDIEYYLYEGNKEEDRVWDGEGTVIPMKDAEDLWNYISSERPHIVDKS